MDRKEAINILSLRRQNAIGTLGNTPREANNTAINVLVDEIYAYEMAIEALDKQIPFTPETNNLKVGLGRCKCGAEFLDKLTNYCGNCGQKILWEAEE